MAATNAGQAGRASANASEAPENIRKNVLILGLRRSGKSSIVEVVYKSLPPDDSLFLESTLKCQTFDVDTFQPVRIWDASAAAQNITFRQSKNAKVIPTDGKAGGANGGHTKDAPAAVIENLGYAWGTGNQLLWVDCAAVIFVIDSQDDIYDAVDQLNEAILDAYAYNPLIHFHVFVHKVDGHSQDYRYDALQNIQSRVADNLADASPSFIFAPVAQDILMEAQADLAEANAAMIADEDAQVAQGQSNLSVDGAKAMSSTMSVGHATATVTGIQQAAASSAAAAPPPPRSLYGTSMSNFAAISGLPSLSVPDLENEVRLSFHATSIYNPSIFVAFSRVQSLLMDAEVAYTLESLCNGLTNSCKFEKVYLFDVPTKTYIAADSSPFDENNFEAVSEYLHFLVQFSGLYANIERDRRSVGENVQDDVDENGVRPSTQRYSSSTAKLSPDTTLGFHQINDHLALAFTMRTDIHARHAGMLDFNIAIARKAITDVYDACHEGTTAAAAT